MCVQRRERGGVGWGNERERAESKIGGGHASSRQVRGILYIVSMAGVWVVCV